MAAVLPNCCLRIGVSARNCRTALFDTFVPVGANALILNAHRNLFSSRMAEAGWSTSLKLPAPAKSEDDKSVTTSCGNVRGAPARPLAAGRSAFLIAKALVKALHVEKTVPSKPGYASSLVDYLAPSASMRTANSRAWL